MYYDDNQYATFDNAGGDFLEPAQVFAPPTMIDPAYWGDAGSGAEMTTIQHDYGFAADTAIPGEVVPTWDYPPEAAPYRALIDAAESQYNLPPKLLGRLLQQESYFNPSAYNAVSGAKGIAQFLDPTARDMGVSDPFDPNQAIPGAAKYLAWLRTQTNNWRETLAAYNWGIGNVWNKGMSRLPLETRKYLAIADDVGVA